MLKDVHGGICRKSKTKRNPEKAHRKYYLSYRRTKIRITLNFSWETMQGKREGSETFKVLKEKTTQFDNKIVLPKWKIKTLSAKPILRELSPVDLSCIAKH